MQDLIVIKIKHNFSAKAEDVFNSFVKKENALKWIKLSGNVKSVEINPVIGGKFLIIDLRDGEEVKTWGYYKAIEKPNRLSFSFFATEEDEKEDNSLVDIKLKDTEKGCNMLFTYSMSSDWKEYEKQTKNAWQDIISKIDLSLKQ